MNPAEWANSSSHYLSDLLFQYIPSASIWGNILALLLVLVQAIMINNVVNQYKMTKEVTYYPALFYILLVSAIPEFLYLSPVLIAMTFYIIALIELFKWYKNYEAATQIFNVGFWLAIGSLFYMPLSVFIILAIAGLSILRSNRIDEFLILIIGILVPYFLLGVYFFWSDGLPQFLQQQVYSNFNIGSFSIENTAYSYFKIGFFALWGIWAVFQASSFFFRQSIQNQKNVSILFWCVAVAATAFLLQSSSSLEALMLLAIPLCYFLSSSFLNMKRKAVPEIIHVLMLVFVFSLQYKEFVWDLFFIS